MNTTHTIRAIVINPTTKSVTEIQMPCDFDTMKREYIKCDMAEVMDFGEGVDAWFDEEGMLKDWDAVGFTNFAGAITLAGNVVLIGRDAENEMANLPVTVTVEEVTELAIFTDPKKVKVKGASITTFAADGTPTTVSIGPENLTYKDH